MCASIDIGNGDGFQEVPELIFPDDKRGGADFHTLGYAFSYEDAAELVTRWNAYPDLIAQRDELLEALKGVKLWAERYELMTTTAYDEVTWQAMIQAIVNASK